MYMYMQLAKKFWKLALFIISSGFCFGKPKHSWMQSKFASLMKSKIVRKLDELIERIG